jgi:AraC-like DNA-binding protein
MSAIEHCWSTDQVEASRALASWTEKASEALLELDIHSPMKDRFSARLRQRPFGPMTASLIEVTAQDVRRTKRHIARHRCDRLDLIFVRRGSLSLQHYGKQADTHSGSCVVMDPDEVYQFVTSESCECLLLQIPRSWLQPWLPNPDAIMAKPLGAASGWEATLVSALSTLSGQDWDDLPLPEGVVAEQIAVLLTLSAGRGTIAPSRHRNALIKRIRQTLADHCHDATFNPQRAANTNGISKRYLHALFASMGSTFGNELMRVRLERAAIMLRDHRFASSSIADIAWRCGFVDQNHFARRFRRHHGISPTAFRSPVTS